jgi:hypothetical protein
MIPESIASRNLDVVIFLENIFEIHIPDEFANHLGDPLGIERSLERHLWSQRPKKDAVALLRMLAEDQQCPELAEGLDGTWRREQISAIVRDIFRKQASPIELHKMLLLPRLQQFGRRPRRFGHSRAGDWQKRLSTKASLLLFGALAILLLLYLHFVR